MRGVVDTSPNIGALLGSQVWIGSVYPVANPPDLINYLGNAIFECTRS